MTANRIRSKACRICYGSLFELDGTVTCAHCGTVSESIEQAAAKPIDWKEFEEKNRLIAAAPDLLDALTDLLADYDNGVTDAESLLLAKCRAAIAKATGSAA